MFLPHIVTRERAAAAEPFQVPAGPVCTVPIVISRNVHPRIDRGAALQVKHGVTWFDYSYHENAAAAVLEFNRPKYGVVGPEFWRVLCHELDLMEFQPVAIRQPDEVWT